MVLVLQLATVGTPGQCSTKPLGVQPWQGLETVEGLPSRTAGGNTANMGRPALSPQQGMSVMSARAPRLKRRRAVEPKGTWLKRAGSQGQQAKGYLRDGTMGAAPHLTRESLANATWQLCLPERKLELATTMHQLIRVPPPETVGDMGLRFWLKVSETMGQWKTGTIPGPCRERTGRALQLSGQETSQVKVLPRRIPRPAEDRQGRLLKPASRILRANEPSSLTMGRIGPEP
mmetsp:Transcript_10484/g.24803  ORF Transcript_10484/g.24803 Transcript_10484/m.24803 type:complete len:232 (-) Transcript_10484:2735-3430(-)